MDLSVFVDRGIGLAKEAVALDNQGQFESAIPRYVGACEYFIAAIKYDKNPHSSALFRKKVAEFITRAEQLKERVEAQRRVQRPVAVAAGATTGEESKASTELPRHFQLFKDADALGWSDVAGMQGAKEVLDEAVIFPHKHPEMFVGKRQPWKSVLLYGPPGTGKTLLVQALAKEAGIPVAIIAASDIMSKYQGSSERAVKELFDSARKTKPCIIFIDEIDSIGRTRVEGEDATARRLKTELLKQLDGIGPDNRGVTFIAATNVPWELDPALRRRFDQLVYIPLPDAKTRLKVLKLQLDGDEAKVPETDLKQVVAATDGYSAADLQIICRETLMRPVRNALHSDYFRQVTVPGHAHPLLTPCAATDRGARRMNMLSIDPDLLYVPAASGADLKAAAQAVPASVSQAEVNQHLRFTEQYRCRDGTQASYTTPEAEATSAATAAIELPDAPTGPTFFQAVSDVLFGWMGPAPAPAPAAPPPPPARTRTAVPG